MVCRTLCRGLILIYRGRAFRHRKKNLARRSKACGKEGKFSGTKGMGRDARNPGPATERTGGFGDRIDGGARSATSDGPSETFKRPAGGHNSTPQTPEPTPHCLLTQAVRRAPVEDVESRWVATFGHGNGPPRSLTLDDQRFLAVLAGDWFCSRAHYTRHRKEGSRRRGGRLVGGDKSWSNTSPLGGLFGPVDEKINSNKSSAVTGGQDPSSR